MIIVMVIIYSEVNGNNIMAMVIIYGEGNCNNIWWS